MCIIRYNMQNYENNVKNTKKSLIFYQQFIKYYKHKTDNFEYYQKA